ncbi:flagellar hook assembly protein FlgD [Alkalicoccus chagannorensis]|uniref:flagellar hook assembly protein FlgD n=1 Tax=Alkalicoccus chagannorensis TaxID=427072 RepID=UPI0004256542|nr:flagellar hook assembly protein FlgD [Alkalicoccus chagannorensis]
MPMGMDGLAAGATTAQGPGRQSALNTEQPTYYEDYVEQQKNQEPVQDMDRDAFLKILLTQLQNQDPMDPMDDKEFVAQMAQFSSLEQMTQLNQTMTDIFEKQEQNSFVSHSDLIGKQVEYNVEGEEGSEQIKEGLVESVSFQNGKAHLVIDGEKVNTDKLVSVRNAE